MNGIFKGSVIHDEEMQQSVSRDKYYLIKDMNLMFMTEDERNEYWGCNPKEEDNN